MKRKAYIIMALVVIVTSFAGCGDNNNGGAAASSVGKSESEAGSDNSTGEVSGNNDDSAISSDDIAFEDITPMPTTVDAFQELPNAPKLSTVAVSYLSDAVALINEDSPEQAVARVVEGFETTGDESLLFYADEMALRVYIKSETTTNQNGEVITTEYDERGNVLSYESAHVKYVNTYDEDGHLLTAKTIEDGDQIVVTEEYEYDSHGNQVKATVTEFGVETVTDIEYDENHNQVYVKVTTDGRVTAIVEYTYYDEDNLCNQMGYYKSCSRKDYEEGNLVEESYAENDEQGNEIYSKTHTPYYDEEYISEFTYDKAGNILKHVEKSTDSAPTITTYSYDNKGNVIKEDVQSGEGDDKAVIHYEYTFDENSNPIEYKCTIDDSEATGGFIAWNKTEYSDDQRMIKDSELGWDGKVIHETRFTYNEDGSHVESEIGYDGEGNITFECKSYYNRLGLLTVTETDHSRSEYVYDSLGNIIAYKDDNYGYECKLSYGIIGDK